MFTDQALWCISEVPVTVIFWFPHSWFTEIWSLLGVATKLIIFYLFTSSKFTKDASLSGTDESCGYQLSKYLRVQLLQQVLEAFSQWHQKFQFYQGSQHFWNRRSAPPLLLHPLEGSGKRVAVEKKQRVLLMNRREFCMSWCEGREHRNVGMVPFTILSSVSLPIWKGSSALNKKKKILINTFRIESLSVAQAFTEFKNHKTQPINHTKRLSLGVDFLFGDWREGLLGCEQQQRWYNLDIFSYKLLS